MGNLLTSLPKNKPKNSNKANITEACIVLVKEANKFPIFYYLYTIN